MIFLGVRAHGGGVSERTPGIQCCLHSSSLSEPLVTSMCLFMMLCLGGQKSLIMQPGTLKEDCQDFTTH